MMSILAIQINEILGVNYILYIMCPREHIFDILSHSIPYELILQPLHSGNAHVG